MNKTIVLEVIKWDKRLCTKLTYDITIQTVCGGWWENAAKCSDVFLSVANVLFLIGQVTAYKL